LFEGIPDFEIAHPIRIPMEVNTIGADFSRPVKNET
jgi:hypothetical protein